jgi:hypothetical protein
LPVPLPPLCLQRAQRQCHARCCVRHRELADLHLQLAHIHELKHGSPVEGLLHLNELVAHSRLEVDKEYLQQALEEKRSAEGVVSLDCR